MQDMATSVLASWEAFHPHVDEVVDQALSSEVQTLLVANGFTVPQSLAEAEYAEVSEGMEWGTRAGAKKALVRRMITAATNVVKAKIIASQPSAMTQSQALVPAT